MQVENNWNLIRIRRILEIIHHTEHFFSGFIKLPFGQLKSLANSSLLDNDPIMRNSPGECAPVLICFFNEPSRHFAHQTCPQLIQKSCFGVKSWPGRVCSSHSLSLWNALWSLSQSTKNRKHYTHNTCLKLEDIEYNSNLNIFCALLKEIWQLF